MCLQPCIVRGHSSMSGSSSSEPVTVRRAISQSPCASHAGLRARRNGGERVRRRITVIESDGDMQNMDMPDEAIRALHAKRRLDDQLSEERYLQQDNHEQRGREGASHANIPNAIGSEFDRIIHAPEGVLPSDTVGYPDVGDRGSASSVAAFVIMIALWVVDMVACVRQILGTLCTIGGKGPPRCQKACRLIIDHRVKRTCGRPCCLPEDHGAVWNHTCTDHAQLGGKVSLSEYRI